MYARIYIADRATRIYLPAAYIRATFVWRTYVAGMCGPTGFAGGENRVRRYDVPAATYLLRVRTYSPTGRDFVERALGRKAIGDAETVGFRLTIH